MSSNQGAGAGTGGTGCSYIIVPFLTYVAVKMWWEAETDVKVFVVATVVVLVIALCMEAGPNPNPPAKSKPKSKPKQITAEKSSKSLEPHYSVDTASIDGVVLIKLQERSKFRPVKTLDKRAFDVDDVGTTAEASDYAASLQAKADELNLAVRKTHEEAERRKLEGAQLADVIRSRVTR